MTSISHWSKCPTFVLSIPILVAGYALLRYNQLLLIILILLILPINFIVPTTIFSCASLFWGGIWILDLEICTSVHGFAHVFDVYYFIDHTRGYDILIMLKHMMVIMLALKHFFLQLNLLESIIKCISTTHFRM
ncbi:hypothetical protein ACJX0J_031137, partial [Zea mays]